uniref:Putative secreted mucin n=1 Tax=Amblyomma cajennense TaxID=34607 RepID=A0A023FBW9_AMBCJ
MAMLRFATFSLALCLLAGLATADNKDSKEPDTKLPASEESTTPSEEKISTDLDPTDPKAGDYESTEQYPFPTWPSYWPWPGNFAWRNAFGNRYASGKVDDYRYDDFVEKKDEERNEKDLSKED